MTENQIKKKETLKNLSSYRCKPTEFLSQTMKIKRVAEKWLKDTDIMNIISQKAKLIEITEKMTDDEKHEVDEKNKELSIEIFKKKASEIFDAIFEKDPSGTLELLALSCFVDPENVDDHTMDEYFVALTEMLNDDSVINFFISFIRLANRPI